MKSGAIRKATEQEREAYEGQYPLYGFVEFTGAWLPIEDLGCWDKDRANPQYEVMAPDGFHFTVDNLHRILCHDRKDIRDRLAHAGDLVLCKDNHTDDCE